MPQPESLRFLILLPRTLFAQQTKVANYQTLAALALYIGYTFCRLRILSYTGIKTHSEQ